MNIEQLDLVRGCGYDGMHLLFIGITHKLIANWIHECTDPRTKRAVLHQDALDQIAIDMQNIILPFGFDLPTVARVKSGFSEMKSDEWRTFLLCVSPVVLKPYLFGDHWTLWLHFYHANVLMALPTVTKEIVSQIRSHLESFVGLCIKTYGAQFISPNIHNSLHIADDILFFGSLRSVWCYGVEQTNQRLKGYSSNYRPGMELTMMKNGKEEFHLGDYLASFDQDNFTDVNTLLDLHEGFLGGYSMGYSVDHFNLYNFILDSRDPNVVINGSESLPPDAHLVFKESKRSILLCDEVLHSLVEFYNATNPHYPMYKYAPVTITEPSSGIQTVRRSVIPFNDIMLGGQKYGSVNSRTERGTIIKTILNDGTPLVGQIQYFFVHHVFRDGEERPHYFAWCNWFNQAEQHSTFHRSGITLYNNFSDSSSVIPVQKIYGVVSILRRDGESFIQAIDVPRKLTSSN
jgi:hypothetical protein